MTRYTLTADALTTFAAGMADDGLIDESWFVQSLINGETLGDAAGAILFFTGNAGFARLAPAAAVKRGAAAAKAYDEA